MGLPEYMYSPVNIIIFILVIASVMGCGSINYRDRIDLPPQNIGIDVPHGTSRIIVFNATESSWVTGGPIATIQIEINGKYAASISGSHYLQLFLKPGDHSIKLEHSDPFAFTDNYTLSVGNAPLYVKIIRKSGNNKLEIVDELPLGFTDNYKRYIP